MTAALMLAAVVVGYVLGRVQPLDRAERWADYRVPDDGRWWHAPPLAAAVFVATAPRGALRAWRHRHDPPPPRSPAIQIPEEEIR